jgi:hypothetical protein
MLSARLPSIAFSSITAEIVSFFGKAIVSMQQSLVLWMPTNHGISSFQLLVRQRTFQSCIPAMAKNFFSAATLQRKASCKPYTLAAVLYI